MKLTYLTKSVKLAEKATFADPSNTQWQRDLSYGYGHLIGQLVAANQFEAAFEAANRGMEIVQELLKGDPDNVRWQRASGLSIGKPEPHSSRRFVRTKLTRSMKGCPRWSGRVPWVTSAGDNDVSPARQF